MSFDDGLKNSESRRQTLPMDWVVVTSLIVGIGGTVAAMTGVAIGEPELTNVGIGVAGSSLVVSGLAASFSNLGL